MEKVVQIQRIIVPELISQMEDRYNILRHIQAAEPVGRRALAIMLGMSERVVRAQVDFFKKAGLVDFSPMGMTITDDGRRVLPDLSECVRLSYGLTGLENELAVKLRLKQVIIVPGNSDAEIMVYRELGRAAARVLGQYLGDNMTIAISGGSTMAAVAEAISINRPGTTVVPVRGGFGERVEYQANTIAALVANKLGGQYRLLHIPDGIKEEVMEVIWASDANVLSVVEMIKHADILVHGIGEAKEMAERRGLEDSIVSEIVSHRALGEALGHYCDSHGECVYVTNSVGLRLDDLKSIGIVMAVAGGRKKAQAIAAVTSAGGQNILVTDEAAARVIQSII